jgi:ectoine hydroxylase-related dioxygenase (phytanoyl-CoA dioxygenase family)
MPDNAVEDRPFSYGVREFRSSSGAAAMHAEEVSTVGYTIVPDVLNPEQVAVAKEKIHAVYRAQCEELGGAEALESIKDADIARCLLAYDDFFVGVAANARVLEIVRELLGANVVLLTQNGIINRPRDDHYQIAWHRDLNYQHFVSSRPLAVSALYCIDEFTPATGSTCMLPASHKVEAFPSPEVMERLLTPVEAPAGSVLMFDAMLFHRAGHNRSGNDRLAINHIYGVPMLIQQISLPAALGGRYADDPELSTLFGYTFEPGASAEEWRRRRLDRARAQ